MYAVGNVTDTKSVYMLMVYVTQKEKDYFMKESKEIREAVLVLNNRTIALRKFVKEKVEAEALK